MDQMLEEHVIGAYSVVDFTYYEAYRDGNSLVW